MPSTKRMSSAEATGLEVGDRFPLTLARSSHSASPQGKSSPLRVPFPEAISEFGASVQRRVDPDGRPIDIDVDEDGRCLVFSGRTAWPEDLVAAWLEYARQGVLGWCGSHGQRRQPRR